LKGFKVLLTDAVRTFSPSLLKYSNNRNSWHD